MRAAAASNPAPGRMRAHWASIRSAVLVAFGLAGALSPILAAARAPNPVTPVELSPTELGRSALAQAQTDPASQTPPAGAVGSAATIPGARVTLRGLDKLTGAVDTFDAEVGAAARYGRLRVEVKACYARTAARAPDSSAFLQIYDTKYDPEALSFSGWMFASSPALSAMDHPRYDVWVLSCNAS